MKVGDVVKLPDGSIHTIKKNLGPKPMGLFRIFQDTWAQESDLQLLTVADLFHEAGFAVPPGAKIFHCVDGPYQWRHVYGDPACLVHSYGWDRGQWWRTGTVYTNDRPDLSRLPAADAWDCLPDVVKAVVGGPA